MTYMPECHHGQSVQQQFMQEMFNDPMASQSDMRPSSTERPSETRSDRKPPQDYDNYVIYYFDQGQKVQTQVKGVEGATLAKKIERSLDNEKRCRRKHHSATTVSNRPISKLGNSVRPQMSHDRVRSQKESSTTAEERPAKRSRPLTKQSPTLSAEVKCLPEFRNGDRPPNDGGPKTISIAAEETEKLEKWFGDAFRAVQQVGCRLIAKIWIKKIHPKKQSTNPYNGAHPRDQPPDPDRTKPPYWPEYVIHKEPDHIDRNARTALLVHLIMHTPQKLIPEDVHHYRDVNARQLKDALEERRSDFKDERWEIIEEIIRAREWMEKYERNECDGNTNILLHDYGAPSEGFVEDAEIDNIDSNASSETVFDQLSLEESFLLEGIKASPSSSTASSLQRPTRYREAFRPSGKSQRPVPKHPTTSTGTDAQSASFANSPVAKGARRLPRSYASRHHFTDMSGENRHPNPVHEYYPQEVASQQQHQRQLGLPYQDFESFYHRPNSQSQYVSTIRSTPRPDVTISTNTAHIDSPIVNNLGNSLYGFGIPHQTFSSTSNYSPMMFSSSTSFDSTSNQQYPHQYLAASHQPSGNGHEIDDDTYMSENMNDFRNL